MRVSVAVVTIQMTVGLWAAETPMSMQAERIEGILWQRFVDTRTGNVLTRVNVGWHGELEDTSLYGGILLAAMIDRFNATQSSEARDHAAVLARGLLANAACGEPGFVARGVKADGTGYLGDPSVDQYTGLLYGLWRYWGSSMPTDEDRSRIAVLFRDILTRLERDGFRVLREDRSRVTTFGHLDRVQPSRAERLLAFLLVGRAVTGDEHWFECYEQLRPARMAACGGFERFAPWVLIQSAISFDMLCRLETRTNVRSVYVAGLQECAERCVPFLDDYEDYRPNLPVKDDGDLVKAVRNPVEAITVILLASQPTQVAAARKHLAALLTTVRPEDVGNSVSLCSLVWDFWLDQCLLASHVEVSEGKE